MKVSGGRKKKNNGGRIAVIIILVAVIAVLAIWILSLGGKDKGNKPDINNPVVNGNNGDVVEPAKPADNTTNKIFLNESALPNVTTPVQEVNESGSTVITLKGDSADVSGNGAAFDASTVYINRAGVYELSGTLNDGRIVVNAKGEDVILVLNGVDVTCSYNSPLYIYKASTVTIIANGKTENKFTDGSEYDYAYDYCDAVNSEPNAAIFSKADLVIRGTGTINVKGNYSGGIIGKDNVKIINTNVNVEAANNGINGKDSLTIQNSTVTVNAGNDGLRSTKSNDASLGYAVFTDSNIRVVANGDAVQIETGLTVNNCSIYLKTGNGAYEKTVSSQKGIKCNQGYITVNSGYLYFDCADDAFNAAGDINVNGGVMNINTGDDAIHSDATLFVNGGTVVVSVCNEGLEGMGVNITDGVIYINSDSDGISAGGGSDNSGFDGSIAAASSKDLNAISITGGYIYINADGDGMDSKGNIYMLGGTVIIDGPNEDENGAIDYSGNFYMYGGTLLASGSDGVAQAPDNYGQNCISVTFDKTVSADEYINISCGDESFTFKTIEPVENIVFSSPILKTGSDVKVSYGGKYSGGEQLDCVYSGGKYSGGSDIKLEQSEGLLAYGEIGIGGSKTGERIGQSGILSTNPGKGLELPK